MMEWVLANWEWIMLGFYTLEKIVKLSPSKRRYHIRCGN